MVKHDALGARWIEMLNLNLLHGSAHLRARFQPFLLPIQEHVVHRVPLGGRLHQCQGIRRIERRNLGNRERLLRRIRAEFAEMPGLSVTLGQAIKLFGLTPESAARIFEELLAARVLRITRDSSYVLRVDDRR